MADADRLNDHWAGGLAGVASPVSARAGSSRQCTIPRQSAKSPQLVRRLPTTSHEAQQQKASSTAVFMLGDDASTARHEFAMYYDI
jgi:hypothetical protein